MQKFVNLFYFLLIIYYLLDIGIFGGLALLYFFILKNWLLAVIHLFFVPQIVHNVIRRQNPGFSYIYNFGFLGVRIIYPVYKIKLKKCFIFYSFILEDVLKIYLV